MEKSAGAFLLLRSFAEFGNFDDRDRAVRPARHAHNVKVVGSNPSPGTSL